MKCRACHGDLRWRFAPPGDADPPGPGIMECATCGEVAFAWCGDAVDAARDQLDAAIQRAEDARATLRGTPAESVEGVIREALAHLRGAYSVLAGAKGGGEVAA